MKVEIYDAYSKKTEVFQGADEDVLKELIDKFGYLKYRCQTVEEAVEELSRSHKNIVSKEE
jgi:endonuclease III